MSERGEIKRTGSKAQKNSGRGKHAKGDAIMEPFCYDIKEYDKSFSVSTTNWGKVCTDAFRSGNREPALQLVLGDNGKTVRLWVISDEMMMQMREAWIEKYGG